MTGSAGEAHSVGDYVDRMAALVGLGIAPEYRGDVVRQLSRLMAVAALVMEFPLPDSVEPGPVFRP